MPERTNFEQSLEHDLQSYLDPYATGPIPAFRSPQRARAGIRILGGAGAALTAKIAVGAAVAVLAAGATTEAVITRSANPVDWARQATQQVQPGQKQPQRGTNSPSAAQAPQASARPAPTPVVKTPGLPAVSAPAVPTPALPVPTPTPLPSLP